SLMSSSCHCVAATLRREVPGAKPGQILVVSTPLTRLPCNARSAHDAGSEAMWNLSGNDIERAKDELAGRRAAIQAAYDNGMKQVEKELADLETFERAAVNMLSHLKGGEE